MKVNKNFILIKPIRDNDKVQIAGVELFMDTTFNDKEQAITHGTVVEPNEHLGVEVGDTLIFFYNLIQPEQAMGDYNLVDEEEDIWAVPVIPGTLERRYNDSNWQAYFAIRGEEIITLGDWNLVEPVFEEDSIKEITKDDGTKVELWTKPEPEQMLQVGNLVNMGDCPEGYESLQPGRIYFNVFSDIPMRIQGRDYVRVRTTDILACEVDGDVVPVGPWAFVDPDPIESQRASGIWVSPVHFEKQRFGVHTGTVRESGPASIVSSGEKVYFDRASGGVMVNNQLLHACHSDGDANDIFGYYG